MTPAARVAAVIEIISEMQAASDNKIFRYRSAGQYLRSGLQRRRYAGSGDRAAIGDLFWKIQRSMARINWHLSNLYEQPNPRNLVLAALVGFFLPQYWFVVGRAASLVLHQLQCCAVCQS